MRARLRFVPSGWEAEEMDGRLRGLIGGGEDIFSFSLSFGLPSPFSLFGPVSAVLRMDVT